MLNVKKIELNPKRNYGIDFLRILSMLFVLLLHILKQGGILSALDKLSLGIILHGFLRFVLIVLSIVMHLFQDLLGMAQNINIAI